MFIRIVEKSMMTSQKSKLFAVHTHVSIIIELFDFRFYGNVRIAKIVEELEDWIRIGVRIIGGCCRVNPEDIKRIANELNKLN